MDDGTTRGPYWDPADNVTFRDYVREVRSWLNVTGRRVTPSQQAAAMQRGLGVFARTIAMRMPSHVVNFWGRYTRCQN